MTVLVWIGMGLCDHARDVSLTDICKPSAFATEYCWKWFLVGIDICISHLKYEVKLNLSPWFSATCATTIAHRNHLSYVPTEYSSSKVKFRQDSIVQKECWRCQVHALSVKQSISQKLASCDLGHKAYSVLNFIKSAIPPLFNGSYLLSSAYSKTKLFS